MKAQTYLASVAITASTLLSSCRPHYASIDVLRADNPTLFARYEQELSQKLLSQIDKDSALLTRVMQCAQQYDGNKNDISTRDLQTPFHALGKDVEVTRLNALSLDTTINVLEGSFNFTHNGRILARATRTELENYLKNSVHE